MILFVQASWPIQGDTDAKFAEAYSKFPPPSEEAKTVSHGPFFFPEPGIGLGSLMFWEVDDAEVLDTMDGLVNACNTITATVPGYTYRLQIAYGQEQDGERMLAKFPPQ